MSPTQALLTIYLITFASGITAVLLYQLDLFGAILVMVQFFAILAVVHILVQTANHH